jgi:hypothetical protein
MEAGKASSRYSGRVDAPRDGHIISRAVTDRRQIAWRLPAWPQSLAASLRARSAESWGMPDRPQKITFADMRDMGVRGLLIAGQMIRSRLTQTE